MEQSIDRKLINWVRMKLLLQCFGVSGFTVMIALPVFKDIFFVEAGRMLTVGLGVLVTLSITGITQLIFNEKWLNPIVKFLENHILKETVQKDQSSSPLRIAGTMFSFWIAIIVVSILVLSFMGNLPLSNYLIFGGVCLSVGFGFSFAWYRIFRQRAASTPGDWDVTRDAIEAGKALTAFPLRSARLSFFLWVYAGIAFGLVFYYLADISRIQSLYVFSIAACAGGLAFPLQYFLFKRSLSIFNDAIATRGGEPILQENFFKISTNSKLLVSFITLITFAIALPGIINYSKTAEIIKQRVAKMGERHLQFLSERFKGRQIESSSEWDSLKKEIAQLDEGNEGSSFVLDQSGKILLGSLPETVEKKYLPEMLQKKEGSFTRLKTDEIIVYRPFPGQPWILGTTYRWHDIKTEVSTIRNLTLMIWIMALLVCIFVAFLTAEDTGKPLASIVSRTKRIAEGHFTDEFPLLSEDELGNLGKSFYQMSQSIRYQIQRSEGLVRTIRNAIERLNSSTTGILSLANYQVSGSAQQAAAVQEAITVSEQVVATAKQISESATSVEKEASQTAVACEQGQEVLASTKAAVADVQSLMKSITASMTALGKRSQEIQGIVKIIEEISDQTNLLALNASIEAASAGEAGKRFAVVAAETRRLAGMTEEANSQINDLIEEIQKAISATIILTEKGRMAVEASAGLLDQEVKTFRDFISLVELSTVSTREISLSTRQQTTALEQMASSISEINKVAQNVVGSAEETKNALNDLKKLAENLTALIKEDAVA